MEIILLLLLVFMIVGSIIAIETRDLLSSVISVGAVGFACSVVFLFLGAPDIAIVQVVVEVLCLVILLRLTVRRDDCTYDTHRDIFSIFTAIFFVGIIISFSYFFLRELHIFEKIFTTANKGEIYNYYIKNALPETKAPNIVTAILLDYRAYDTLGEATVIFTAIVGALALLRKVGRKK